MTHRFRKILVAAPAEMAATPESIKRHVMSYYHELATLLER